MNRVLKEMKHQRWRALAMLNDGTEALICLGNTVANVRESYLEPWLELFDEDVRKETDEIVLQKWIGEPDRGEWVTQANLPLLQMAL